MLDSGIITESSSPWAAPIVLIRKKDGTLRFCVDNRKLNLVTDKDAFPLPRIEESLTSLKKAAWYSTLDLAPLETWTADCKGTFEKLKAALLSAPIVAYVDWFSDPPAFL